MPEEMVVPGIYKHFKGNQYEVFGVAENTETGELLVVYRALYGERALWARPILMFLESVDVEGKKMPRFALIEK